MFVNKPCSNTTYEANTSVDGYYLLIPQHVLLHYDFKEAKNIYMSRMGEEIDHGDEQLESATKIVSGKGLFI